MPFNRAMSKTKFTYKGRTVAITSLPWKKSIVFAFATIDGVRVPGQRPLYPQRDRTLSAAQHARQLIDAEEAAQ
jgi:hypothetical protein